MRYMQNYLSISLSGFLIIAALLCIHFKDQQFLHETNGSADNGIKSIQAESDDKISITKDIKDQLKVTSHINLKRPRNYFDAKSTMMFKHKIKHKVKIDRIHSSHGEKQMHVSGGTGAIVSIEQSDKINSTISVETLARVISTVPMKQAVVVDNATTNSNRPHHLTNNGIKLHQIYNIDIYGDIMFPYMINNPTICSHDNIHAIILVVTSPGNIIKRNILRTTWAKTDLLRKYPTRTVYIIGNSYNESIQDKLKQESERYGDIVQADFKDSYHNLTLKVLVGIKWVLQYCKQAKFVLRVNEDMLIDTLILFDILEKEYRGIKRGIMGLKMFNANASIERGGVNCGSVDDISAHKVFPLYVNRNIFIIITQDLLHELYQTALTITFFRIEDVFLTSFVSEAMKNVNFVFLDQYIEIRSINKYIAQVTHTTKSGNGAGPYFAIAMAHPFTTTCMCAWAIRLLHLTTSEIEVFGGLERFEALWTNLTQPILIRHLYNETGVLTKFPKYNKDTIFSFGLLCSHLLNTNEGLITEGEIL